MPKENSGNWTTVIRPRRGWLDLHLGELVRYRDLILLLVKRDFTVVYKQTILGPAWAVIQPILTTLIFTVVFGNIASLPTDSMPPFLFYMCGSVAWQYFAGCLNNTSNTFARNARLFGKVYFPRLCMPIATVLSQLITFSIQFALFLVFLVYYGTRPNPVVHPNLQLILLTPLLLMQMAMLGLGFGIIVSALTTKYRDLAMLVSFGVHLWMYATPVTYPASMILSKYPRLMGLYMLNPMTPVIELFRAAYLGVPGFDFRYCWPSLLITLAVLALGVLLFSHTEKTFMDTV